MLEIGTQAPDFSLPEPLTGQIVNLSDYQDCPLLVVFSCNHCPYVLHILKSFSVYAGEIQKLGLAIVMINANDVENYADDSPQNMVRLAHQYGWRVTGTSQNFKPLLCGVKDMIQRLGFASDQTTLYRLCFNFFIDFNGGRWMY